MAAAIINRSVGIYNNQILHEGLLASLVYCTGG